MTRDEAKMALTRIKIILPKPEECILELKTKVSTIYEIVDTIFDDFEKKSCKNCKYREKAANGDEFDCSVLMAHTREQALELINSGFGCNRFEPKEVEH